MHIFEALFVMEIRKRSTGTMMTGVITKGLGMVMCTKKKIEGNILEVNTLLEANQVNLYLFFLVLYIRIFNKKLRFLHE